MDRFLDGKPRNVSIFRCKKCVPEKTFYRRDDFRIHMRNVHKIQFEETERELEA